MIYIFTSYFVDHPDEQVTKHDTHDDGDICNSPEAWSDNISGNHAYTHKISIMASPIHADIQLQQAMMHAPIENIF